MPVTPTIQNSFPTVGASADTWGGTLNNRGGETYVDINALATQGNATEAVAGAALPRAGGTMTGNIILPVGASASPAEAGFKGCPPVALTPGGSKTLTSVDAGAFQVLASGNNTVTIAPGLGVGMAIPFKNEGAGTITIARGVGVILTLDGANVNKDCTIGAYGKATLTCNSTNKWSISGVVVA